MSHTQQPELAPRRRWGLGALLAGTLLFLAACGAEVSSELEISEDESGTRTMVATIVEDDLEFMEGGIEATEAAIEAHLPEQLSFEGISDADAADEDIEGASESYLAVFELEFSDMADYRSKAQALLDLSIEKENEATDSSYGEVSEKTVEIAFEQNDGPLLDGVILEENFSGTELLNWAAYALVDEGVVAQEDAGSVISTTGTESRVVIGGEEYDTSEPFWVDEGTDYRFSSVSVMLTENGAIVDLAAAFDYGDYDAGFEAAQQYLDEAEVGEVEDNGDGYWTVTLDDSDSLQEQLSALLGMDELEIQVEETANTESATLLTTLTGTGFRCDAACQYTPSISIDWSSDSITPVDEEVDGDTFTISYERAVRIDEATVDTEVALNGDVGQTYRFTVGSSQVEAFGEDLDVVFAPPEGTGSMDTEVTEDSTVFITTLDATDPAALNSTLDEFLPGSSVEVAGFAGIWPEYTINVSASGVETSFGVTPNQSMDLPVMHSANQDASAGVNDDLTSDSPAYSVVASGPTSSGLITLGIIAVVVITAIVLIVIFRKRIATGLRSAQQQAQTVAASTSESWQAASQQRAATDAGATAATATTTQTLPPQADLLADDGAWQTDFNESKLQ